MILDFENAFILCFNLKWVCTLLNQPQDAAAGLRGLQDYFFRFDGAAAGRLRQRLFYAAMFFSDVNNFCLVGSEMCIRDRFTGLLL